jgi:hypothetical protein
MGTTMHGLVEWRAHGSWESWTEAPFCFEDQHAVIEALGGRDIVPTDADDSPLYSCRGLPPDPSVILRNIHYLPIFKSGDPEALKSDPHILFANVPANAHILSLHRDYVFCGRFHHCSFLSSDEVRNALAHCKVPPRSDVFLEALLRGMDILNQYFVTRFVFWFSS